MAGWKDQRLQIETGPSQEMLFSGLISKDSLEFIILGHPIRVYVYRVEYYDFVRIRFAGEVITPGKLEDLLPKGTTFEGIYNPKDQTGDMTFKMDL